MKKKEFILQKDVLVEFLSFSSLKAIYFKKFKV